MKRIFALFIYCICAQMVCAEANLTVAERREMYDGMIPETGRSTLAYRAAVIQKMLGEANYFADRLRLPPPHPIRMTDIKMEYTRVASMWDGVIRATSPPYDPISVFGSNIYNSNIPRETRLRALKIGADGSIETSNFVFIFHGPGRIREVMRITEHGLERYARNLDQLVGKPSLITEAQAHELATQWLAAVDVDVVALDKQKWVIHQLRYLAKGASNAVALPLYHVDFGSIHYHFGTNAPNMQDFDEPMVRVEILGTTKELQDITINDSTFSRRPLLLITNALDLVRMHDPPSKKLESLPSAPTTSLTESGKQESRKILLELKKELESLPSARTNPPNEQQKQEMLSRISERLKELESSPPAQTNSPNQSLW
jgi:hypothetical protein